jgi:tetraacyldisaccharide-1-P 4'-kinase
LDSADVSFEDDLDVVITAKDAIKLTAADLSGVWCLEVAATLDERLIERLFGRILPIRQGI